MTFTAFVIICVIAMLGYYIYLALSPEKKGFSYEDESDFDTTQIDFDPPIAVTTGMVSFFPTVTDEPAQQTPPVEETNDDQLAQNRYNQTTVVSDSSLATAEISAFYTKEAIKEGELLFSNIFMQKIN